MKQKHIERAKIQKKKTKTKKITQLGQLTYDGNVGGKKITQLGTLTSDGNVCGKKKSTQLGTLTSDGNVGGQHKNNTAHRTTIKIAIDV